MARFELFHTQFGETVHIVSMDEELLRPEAGIVDADTMTLRPLKTGGNFTLIPLEHSHAEATLKRVHEVYTRITTEGCPLHSTWINRMDELLQIVGLMFKKIEYKLVENAEDMQLLLVPPDDPDWVPKTVEFNAIGDLLDMVITPDNDAAAPDETFAGSV